MRVPLVVDRFRVLPCLAGGSARSRNRTAVRVVPFPPSPVEAGADADRGLEAASAGGGFIDTLRGKSIDSMLTPAMAESCTLCVGLRFSA